jgi:hypothetical protein
MQQTPTWETKSRAANQEIPRLLGKLKVYYRVHNTPPRIHIQIAS